MSDVLECPEVLDHSIASTADAAVAAFIGNQLLPPTGACVHGRGVNPQSHGTHVSATAAGNHVTVTASNGATPQTITGVAPRARLATYKVKKELLGQSTSCLSIPPWAGNAAGPLTAAACGVP
jgi:subtilisin family serine protease